jgi:cardiolipin synthase
MLINNIRLYRLGIRMDGSKWYGKIATAVFYFCMFVLVIFPYLSEFYTTFLIVLTAGFQVGALIGYSGLFSQMYKEAAK